MKNYVIAINLLASISCVGLGVKFLVLPELAKSIYKEDYQALMFKCDNVMRDHLIAKNRVKYEPSQMSLKQLKATEVSLLSCHDYDKLRKKMKSWGVTSNDLSYLGLEAMEKNLKNVIEYVETHEIKY
mgnify:CR=1 FL=1